MAAADNVQNAAAANPTIKVLDDEALLNHEEDEAEVEAYAEHIGIDIEHDRDLFWIAREGLCAVPPAPWKACQVDGEDEVFYFNFETGESVWDHPSDDVYRQRVQKELERRVIAPISLSIEDESLRGLTLRARNLAGLDFGSVHVSSPATRQAGEVLDALAASFELHEGVVPRFVLPNAKLISYSMRAKSLQEVLFEDETEEPALEG